jgi:hypothetical protein
MSFQSDFKNLYARGAVAIARGRRTGSRDPRRLFPAETIPAPGRGILFTMKKSA